MSAHLVELNDIFLHLSTVSIDSDPLAAATSFSLELKTQIPFSVLTANTQTAHSAFWSNYFRRGLRRFFPEFGSDDDNGDEKADGFHPTSSSGAAYD